RLGAKRGPGNGRGPPGAGGALSKGGVGSRGGGSRGRGGSGDPSGPGRASRPSPPSGAESAAVAKCCKAPPIAAELVRCVQTGPGAGDCVTVREEVVAHRSRPHLYLQRIRIANPTERLAAFEASAPAASALGGRFASSLEKVEERQFLLSSGRLPLAGSPKMVLVVVAAKKLVSRVQVAPKSHFDETLLSVVYTSEPIEVSRLEETFSKLREAAKKEMLEVMQMGVEDLFQEHQQTWSDLFISGIEMRKITDAHTPSSETVNMTLYYVLSTMPAPLLEPLIGGEDREKIEASLNYADHCFSGHATMHAQNLWPPKLTSVSQILQLSDLWKLTLQKRGCKGLVTAGVHGLMQGMVLSFGGLQFTENHLQFQADPDVLHNSYSLRGIHYNKDLINLAVLLDAEGKPFLHVSVKFQDKPVRLYACEAGCMNEPVELTSEARGHTFPVMVTQPITPLLYISTDLVHLQDLRHTLHLKAILAHEEHMAKQYPGLPFLFWFSVASLITLFHLFLFKLIYNEYCGPGAKPLFRSKV
uniref:KIAA2013 n=1 Tax=Ficedula albicollis TaxID=59894 RepID=A0A803VA34_FICAL